MMRAKTPVASPEIEALISLLAKVPGLGPRSARRAALQLLKKRETLMQPLAEALSVAAAAVKTCSVCGNLDTRDPCGLCVAPGRDDGLICVVADVQDIWALERASAFRGRYHVLGGLLSALDGVGPDDLRLAGLVARAQGIGALPRAFLNVRAQKTNPHRGVKGLQALSQFKAIHAGHVDVNRGEIDG